MAPAFVSFSRNSQIVRASGRGSAKESKKTHERQAVVDQELCALVGEIVRRLNEKNSEHHHRIERRTATLRSVRIRKHRVEFRPERLEIHRDPKGLELVAEVAQTLQPIIDIKKTRLVAHRIISHPPTRMESEMLKLGQVFRTVQMKVDGAGNIMPG